MSHQVDDRKLIAPDTTTTPRADGLGGRILSMIGAGVVVSDELRSAFGVHGEHPFHQRLGELVERGWVVHTVSLTEAGLAALERMKRRG